MKPDNCYDDARRADAYAKLEFPGTYYLAFRDLPDLIFEQVGGRAALDFGCGAGRSTRFLRQLGFDAIGVDVSAEMVRKALEIGPGGDYRLIDDSVAFRSPNTPATWSCAHSRSTPSPRWSRR